MQALSAGHPLILNGRQLFLIMILYGKNSVAERIKSNPASIHKIIVKEGFSDPFIGKLLKKYKIREEHASLKKLNSKKRPKDHQGILAEVAEFEYTDINKILSVPDEDKPSLIFIDRINDPQNLGGIIRILACFGRFALVIPKYKSCLVNDTVVHVACGAENYVPVCLVSNIPNTIIKARKSGYWIVGSSVESDSEDIRKTELSFPVGLVLGSEAKGIRYGITKQLDKQITIPMSGEPLSFNVAMATAIFCYEISRQREVLR